MRSLYAHCIETLELAEDSEDAVYVFAESVLYLLGQNSAFEFQNLIRKFCINISAKCFRLTLCEHRYSNLNIKLFLIHLAKDGTTRHMARKSAKAFGVSNRDAQLMWMLFNTNPWFCFQVYETTDKISWENPLLTLKGVDTIFNRVFPKVFPYIKYLTYRKLRFLAKSTNSELSDFHSELSAKIVQSYYSLVPTEKPEEYIVNYLKQAAHNHTINLIKTHTTQKRGRLISTGFDSHNERQFSLLCVSQNQMEVTEGEESGIDGEDATKSGFELRFSLSEVLDSVKNQSKKYKFLSLLMGSEDLEFTNWLRSRGVCSQSEDNVDVQERVGSNDYTGYVSTYLCVSRERVDSLFDSLRMQLAL